MAIPPPVFGAYANHKFLIWRKYGSLTVVLCRQSLAISDGAASKGSFAASMLRRWCLIMTQMHDEFLYLTVAIEEERKGGMFTVKQARAKVKAHCDETMERLEAEKREAEKKNIVISDT